MRWISTFIVSVLLALGLSATPAAAQQPVGRCVDQMRGQAFIFLSNNYAFQEGFPQNAGFAMRDPSGMTFMRVPAAQPWLQAFFISWQGQLVEINRQGSFIIGACQFHPGFVMNNPYQNVWTPPVMHPSLGVIGPNDSFMPLPQQIVNPDRPFGLPMIASENQAVQCWGSSGGDRDRFGECMLHSMAGQRERAAFDCANAGGGSQAVAICMVGALGGERERRIATTLAECRQQYGENYDQYPLCMAAGNVDGETGRLLACVQQQGRQQGQVTFMGTAMCYGAGRLGLNPEMQIVAQCAIASNGEPYTFVGCAGGQLTARELDKCFTGGVGGPNGCFGPNNTIVQAFQGVGNAIGQQFGPNNTLVRTWNNAVNDISHGPGPNNTVRQTFQNVANEVARAPGNVARAVERVVPRIRIRCC